MVKRVLVTGSDGFIGKNLIARLSTDPTVTVLPWNRNTADEVADSYCKSADVIVSLAGINRPPSSEIFEENASFLARLVTRLNNAGNAAPIAFSSSIQASNESDYGRSKRAAEELLQDHISKTKNSAAIYRLPNVFGKWGRPNYNSAVNTFCYNIGRGLPISIHDSNAPLRLVYVDDVVDALVAFVNSPLDCETFPTVTPEYHTTVGQVADLLTRFKNGRDALTTERVGTGLERALYSTYLSYLPTEAFSYQVVNHNDERGSFVEMLKTPDSGQFSYFTSKPGITRGGHYHHTKVEKFLVIQGEAHFRFRNLADCATYSITTSGSEPMIVETIPGWVHDVTNIGTTDLVCMLWANEVFDRERPDTYASKI